MRFQNDVVLQCDCMGNMKVSSFSTNSVGHKIARVSSVTPSQSRKRKIVSSNWIRNHLISSITIIKITMLASLQSRTVFFFHSARRLSDLFLNHDWPKENTMAHLVPLPFFLSQPCWRRKTVFKHIIRREIVLP